MSRFTRWSRIAHTALAKFHPEIRFEEAQEILAAYLGHSTCASFRMHDSDVLDERTKYVLADPEAALVRARSLNSPLTPDEWEDVEIALQPSGVTGNVWLIHEEGMHRAASLTVTDADDSRLHEIAGDIGRSDGYRSTHTRCHSPSGEFPLELRFAVDGEIYAISDAGRFAVPVVCEVSFPRVGNRFYGVGQVVSVARRGGSTECEPRECL